MKSVDIVDSLVKFDDVIPFLVEVEFDDSQFLRVKESLTRIGINAGLGENGKPNLTQTCHVLSKKGKYYICHFKTLFVLDGRDNKLTVSDIARQNLIIKLMQDWSLLTIVNPDMIKDPMCSLKTISIIKYQDVENWNLISKYDIGACLRKQQNQVK
jgi:hypothetical protein